MTNLDYHTFLFSSTLTGTTLYTDKHMNRHPVSHFLPPHVRQLRHSEGKALYGIFSFLLRKPAQAERQDLGHKGSRRKRGNISWKAWIWATIRGAISSSAARCVEVVILRFLDPAKLRKGRCEGLSSSTSILRRVTALQAIRRVSEEIGGSIRALSFGTSSLPLRDFDGRGLELFAWK